MFADDLKVYKVIKSKQNCEELQRDINYISEWGEINNLFINPNKCRVIRFTRKHRSKIPIFEYKIKGSKLEYTNIYKDLGVTIDQNLSFEKHINNIINKSNMKLGYLIRNTKHFKNFKCLTTLFCTLIRSTLDYAAVIWRPYNIQNKNALERIQKKFIKYICYRQNIEFHNINYDNLLQNLNLITIEKRYIILDLITAYKILNSKYNCSETQNLNSINTQLAII